MDLCHASSIRIHIFYRGLSSSWPAGRRRAQEAAPRPFGTDGRSPVSPEFSLHGTRRQTALKSEEEEEGPYIRVPCQVRLEGVEKATPRVL